MTCIAGHARLAAAGLLAAATLAGCSAADETPLPDLPERGTLTVEVTDNGYGAHETRTSEEGWRTQFTSGDRVGLYVVKAGKVITDNLCLLCGENGEWTPQTAQPLRHDAGAAYYAYYPWQADMTGKTDPAAANAEGFFAPLVADWTPAADQSTHNAYTASDLMTCAGTVGSLQADNTYPLTLGLSHRMAIAAVRMPNVWFTTPDGFEYSSPMPLETEVQFTMGGAACKPYYTEGFYRILYHPAAPAEVKGTFLITEKERSFSFTPDVPAARYKVYRVDRKIADRGVRAIVPGDLYYADGSILPVDWAAHMAPGTAPRGCIGIVFQTDPNRICEVEKELFAAKGMTVHGIAMSVKSAGDNMYCEWYNNESETGERMYTRDESVEDPNHPGYYLPNLYDAKNSFKSYALADADINGYFNTQVIKLRHADDLAAGWYPAFGAAVDFATEAGGPAADAATSGWYLPANGQVHDFLRNVAGIDMRADDITSWPEGDFCWALNKKDVTAALNEAMQAIPDEDKQNYNSAEDYIWTSSAAAPAMARQVQIYGNGSVVCMQRYKNYKWSRVRCAIAF